MLMSSCTGSDLTGLVVVSLHHSQVHGRCWLRYGPLSLGGVAFGPVGADTHLLYVGELRRAGGQVHWTGDACEHKQKPVGFTGRQRRHLHLQTSAPFHNPDTSHRPSGGYLHGPHQHITHVSARFTQTYLMF